MEFMMGEGMRQARRVLGPPVVNRAFAPTAVPRGVLAAAGKPGKLKRCRAKTEDGTRCKLKTRDASGLCHVHR